MINATRRAAWRDGSENGWHDDLIWYAAGIHRMRQLTPGLDDFFRILRDAMTGNSPAGSDPVAELIAIARQWNDPRSLGHQSQVHGTFVDRADWPQDALWQECAHNQWFFLPWHRAYLLEYEAVVREHIRDLGGPADEWGLPYWNYSDHADDASRLQLPLPLQGETLPEDVEVPGVEAGLDGTFPNPLFVPVRFEEAGEDPEWAVASDALQRPHFANQDDRAAISFGGGVLDSPNNAALFHRADEIGELDRQPHGSVHGHVGGAMGLFETAALDPVFWMHHCNVDRLWETFANDLGHGYPFQNGVGTGTQAHHSWTDQQFRFLQPDSTIRTWTAPEVLDIGTLGYVYDSTAAPPLAPPPAPLPGQDDEPFGLDSPRPDPNPIAEAAGQVSLAGEQDVAVSGGDPGSQDVGPDAFPPESRWLLRFEGIRAARPAVTSYRVYLGLEPGAATDRQDADHYAGLLSLFGVHESSRDDGSSSASGQSRVLDVTPQVRAQAASLRPLATSVRLVPLDPERDLGGMGLSIERITLEFV
jgi:tyrosinase